MTTADFDRDCLERALVLAAQGQGIVEPNPMVGCVIARDGKVIAEGWHQRYGGPHAEIVALQNLAPGEAAGATMYVSLEPCCHHGKTPPCTDAIIAAKVRRVVIAMQDPAPHVDGGGMQQLQAAGIQVEYGPWEKEARNLNAPYLMLVEQQRPWTIAKWAMTLDGKLATSAGDSQWISNDRSRAIVHELRRRVDGIVIGSGTALRDDPLLTARPPGPRTLTRIVLDSSAQLSASSQLAKTSQESPVLVAVGPQADPERLAALQAAGCEIWHDKAREPYARLANLWRELGRRRMTNVLVEGGAKLFGSLFDNRLIDEVHAFVAPKLAGGGQAASPIAGIGQMNMSEALRLEEVCIQAIEGDAYIQGRVQRRANW